MTHNNSTHAMLAMILAATFNGCLAMDQRDFSIINPGESARFGGAYNTQQFEWSELKETLNRVLLHEHTTEAVTKDDQARIIRDVSTILHETNRLKDSKNEKTLQLRYQALQTLHLMEFFPNGELNEKIKLSRKSSKQSVQEELQNIFTVATTVCGNIEQAKALLISPLLVQEHAQLPEEPKQRAHLVYELTKALHPQTAALQEKLNNLTHTHGQETATIQLLQAEIDAAETKLKTLYRTQKAHQTELSELEEKKTTVLSQQRINELKIDRAQNALALLKQDKEAELKSVQEQFLPLAASLEQSKENYKRNKTEESKAALDQLIKDHAAQLQKKTEIEQDIADLDHKINGIKQPRSALRSAWLALWGTQD